MPPILMRSVTVIHRGIGLRARTFTVLLGIFFCTMDSMAAPPMTLQQYLALSGPEPSAHLAYGHAPSQYVELFVPPGSESHPVVVLVHGGCWVKEYAGITQMRDMAGALAAQGIAVWNVEYRRVDEEGGGYPGTYQDIASALDLLRSSAAEYRLDTRRIVAVGHSAGGHLVQWLAGRVRIAPSSSLFATQPFRIRQVIALGSISDLRTRQDSQKRICGVDVVKLTGTISAARTDVYSDTSPAELVPNGSHTVLINGELDTVSPPDTAADFAKRAIQAGDSVETLVLPQASHYDEVASTSAAWARIFPMIRKALD
jgi:acetyl esterase/lipase